jgi:Fur family peroxide stress response transcriptional regulator
MSYIIIMPKNNEGVERILRDRGARVTPQRVAILQAVASTGSHPDADAVYRVVSRKYPHISRDTVYRTLSMMEEKKIIGAVLFVGNAKRYDPMTAQHHHLVCIRCRRIFDFEERKFDRLAPPTSAVERFKVVRTTVHVEGICDACQRRSQAG